MILVKHIKVKTSITLLHPIQPSHMFMNIEIQHMPHSKNINLLITIILIIIPLDLLNKN
jgi:hypothetical protein